MVMLVRQAGFTGLGRSSGDNLLRFHGVCCEALSVIERTLVSCFFGDIGIYRLEWNAQKQAVLESNVCRIQ